MQVSVETTSGLERRLTIAIPADKIQAEVDKRIVEVAPKVNLNGFRKGKVPASVVRQQYGPGIRQEVLGEMMSQSFQDAVIQEKLRPAGQPAVEPKETDPKKDFSFTATFEIYPELEVAPLTGVEVKKPITAIDASDVDSMIENLRKQQATFEEVDRAAKADDQVNIDYKGLKDGEAFEGGTAEGSDLVIGSSRMIPGFEDGLVGLKAGDEKSLELSFPEDYHAEELKGAAVVFEVKVNSVKEQVLPELNAEFMEKYGAKDGDLEAFKADIEKNMQNQLKQALQTRVKSQVMDALLEKNTIEVPKALVDQEINAMRQQMFQQFGGQAQNIDESMLPAELFSEQATRRVSLGLLLSAVIENDEIKADDDKVRAMVEEIASSYEAADEVIDYYYNNPQQLQQVEGLVLENAVVEKLLEQADVSDEKLSYEELMQATQGQQM